VRHLIELHGGTVEAESAGKGRGATFTVRFPLAENVENSVPPQSDALAVRAGSLKEISADAPDIRGLRVLIVDDDPDTLEVLRAVLKQYGARVRIAVSTADALEVFREWRPDVLISDLAMPVEDGYSLISKIRALTPEQGGNVPAAALTAYAAETDRRRSRAAGYQIHIAKPLDPTTIAAAVAEIKRKV
jgi:CheY-like chemotaxis protein